MCVARAHRCWCALKKFNNRTPQFYAHTTLYDSASTIPTRDLAWSLLIRLSLFPNQDRQPMEKGQVIRCFQPAISATGTPLYRPGPGGNPLPRFQQHICRVSGAQFLTRLGYTLEAVQLIGRWGCCQTLCSRVCLIDATPNSLRIPRERTPQDVRQMVADYLPQLQHKYWIINAARLPSSRTIDTWHSQ